MDLDSIILLVVLASTVTAFAWRRTRLQILYYAWLGLLWLETEVRKRRDGKQGPRSI